MSNDTHKQNTVTELKIKGTLVTKGVRITKQQHIDELYQRGYGTAEKKELLLTFYEAYYLVDKGILEVEDRKGKTIDSHQILRLYEEIDENAWVNYLVYRDLRSRGYVVREGFGSGVDFRVYDRGDYSKDTAKYLIINVQEGKPIPIEDLTKSLTQSLSLKKELIVAVMNRRGEIVYYSISELNLK